jgi:hypothetical protein
MLFSDIFFTGTDKAMMPGSVHSPLSVGVAHSVEEIALPSKNLSSGTDG